MKTTVNIATATPVVGLCRTDEDFRPPFHHCVPLLPPGTGRRSCRGVGGVAVVSTAGLSPCTRRSGVVDLAGGGSGGVHRSAG